MTDQVFSQEEVLRYRTWIIGMRAAEAASDKSRFDELKNLLMEAGVIEQDGLTLTEKAQNSGISF